MVIIHVTFNHVITNFVMRTELYRGVELLDLIKRYDKPTDFSIELESEEDHR